METSELYYYALGEIVLTPGNDNVLYPLTDPYSYRDQQTSESPESKGWLGMIQAYLRHSAAAVVSSPTELGSDEVITLFSDFIIPKCFYEDCVISETDYSALFDSLKTQDVPLTALADCPDEIKSFVARVGSWISGTYPKYKKLIDLYAAEKDKLLDKLGVTTSGKTRYNDMPQSPIVAGDLEGDDHLTTLTKDDNESQTDPTTPIMRLAEIEANFKNLYNDWADEFVKTFIIM